jgi:MYXO-CTERM domain-containing protein
MKFKFFSNILTNAKLKKILPALLLVSVFQAHAAVITVGNLSYDGTLITGGGHTYLGFDILKDLTHAQTVALTSDGGTYESYRIANTADADVFIHSLFGGQNNQCSTIDGVATNGYCGNISAWNGNGTFGDNYGNVIDVIMFLADESFAVEVGYIGISDNGDTQQFEEWANHANGDYVNFGYLLVQDTAVSSASVPSPSSLAIFVLGLVGIGLARRRRY